MDTDLSLLHASDTILFAVFSPFLPSFLPPSLLVGVVSFLPPTDDDDGRGAHHMVGCMSKSYGRVAENHGLSYGRPLYHVMSGCYRFLEVSTI